LLFRIFLIMIKIYTMKKVLTLIVIAGAIVLSSCEQKKQTENIEEQQKETKEDMDKDVSEEETVSFEIMYQLADNNLKFPYEQKELGFGYDALEPDIDAATMEVHFSKHHAGYTAKFNKATEDNGLQEMSIYEIFANTKDYPDFVRNNGGGFYNHYLYWQFLSPDGGEPSEKLSNAINSTFGDMETFKGQFDDAAKSQFGSGWAWLCVDENGELFITHTSNQDNPLMDIADKNGIPVLCLDVWEHAYYLKYQSNRAEYVTNFWNVVNWNEVDRRYQEAMTVLGK
jgi:Fe-Mn family superoxide dismutase